MIVCSCKAVNDRRITRAVEQGAATVEEVGEACGAGTKCGSCRPVVHEIIETARGMCNGCFDCPRKAEAA